MGHLVHCWELGQTTRRRWPFDSDLPFQPLPSYAVLRSVLAGLLLAASSTSHAAIIRKAASPSLASVAAAVASAVDGDTVVIPAGTASWTSQLVVTKGITIQGQTTTDSANGTANDQTILVDNLRSVPGDQGFFKLAGNQPARITGITFSGVDGRTTRIYSNGALRLSGSDNVRVDHCHFTGLRHNPAIEVYVNGVADHCVFDNLVSQCFSFQFRNSVDGYGHYQFAHAAGWGGRGFFFVEDCYINNTAGPFTASGGMDAENGGKYVVRHCHLFDVEILCHGTGTNGPARGGRAQELYNNDYHWDYTTKMDGITSGSLLVHDNTYVGNRPTSYSLQTYRLFYRWDNQPWLGASGDNNWDVNVTEADGATHIDGHPPYLFGSGTVTSGSENSGVGEQYLTDTSQSWTPNQWVGYTAKRVSDNWIGQVLSNTSNTLTMYFYSAGGGTRTTWRAGDQYQFQKVLIALDQPGRGQGDLITGTDTPINSTTGGVAWPHQALEPCYSWNNIHLPGGEHINFGTNQTSQATLISGRDYFNDTPMPGYRPYTYPHPLTVSGGNGLAAPQDLRIMP